MSVPAAAAVCRNAANRGRAASASQRAWHVTKTCLFLMPVALLMAIGLYGLYRSVTRVSGYQLSREEVTAIEVDVYDYYTEPRDPSRSRFRYAGTVRVADPEAVSEAFRLLCSESEMAYRNHDGYRKHYFVYFVGPSGDVLDKAIRIMPSTSSRTNIYLTEPGYIDHSVGRYSSEGDRVAHVAVMTNAALGQWVERMEQAGLIVRD